MNVRCFVAGGEPRELWEVPAAGHPGGLDARPREDETRVVSLHDREPLGE